MLSYISPTIVDVSMIVHNKKDMSRTLSSSFDGALAAVFTAVLAGFAAAGCLAAGSLAAGNCVDPGSSVCFCEAGLVSELFETLPATVVSSVAAVIGESDVTTPAEVILIANSYGTILVVFKKHAT